MSNSFLEKLVSGGIHDRFDSIVVGQDPDSDPVQGVMGTLKKTFPGLIKPHSVKEQSHPEQEGVYGTSKKAIDCSNHYLRRTLLVFLCLHLPHLGCFALFAMLQIFQLTHQCHISPWQIEALAPGCPR